MPTTFIDQKSAELIRFVQTIVRIRSEHSNETEVAKAIAAELSKYGVRAKLVGQRKDRKNLVAEFGSKKGKTLALNGHLDTVPAGDSSKWRMDPFAGVIHGDRLYGRGSYDMKGSVAALCYAFIALKVSGSRPPGRLQLALSVDEEGGDFSGIKELLKHGYGGDAAIVGEPVVKNSIRVGARGIYRFKVAAIGKTAHTAYPAAGGINAATKLAKLLLALEKITVPYERHKLFAPPNITPGTIISGGVGINVVPDHVEASIDFRMTYGQTKTQVKREIKKCLDAVCRTDKQVRYKIIDLNNTPPFLTDLDDPVIEAAKLGVRDVLGLRPKMHTMNGASDANYLGAQGIPSVVFGALGAGAHAENEYVSTKSVIQMAKSYVCTAQHYFEIC